MKVKSFEQLVFEAAVKEFGVEAQMDIAVEECSELIKAIIKLRRSEKGQYWGGRKPTLEDKAHEAYTLKKTEELVKEVADVQIMLDQIRFMIPGKYAEAYEDQLNKFAQELRNRGYTLNYDLKTGESI